MAISTSIVCRVYKGAKTSTAFTAEAMTDSGDHTTYYITNRVKAYWDDSAATTVYVNGSPTACNISYLGGYVTFGSSQGAATITATGKYYAIDKGFIATGYDLEIGCNEVDITALGDTGERSAATVQYGKLTLDAVHEDNKWFDLLGQRIVIAVAESGTFAAASITNGSVYEFYMHPITVKMLAKAKDAVRDTITWSSDSVFQKRVYT